MTFLESKRLTKQDVIDKLVESNVKLLKTSTDLIVSMNQVTKKVDELIGIFKKAAEHIEKGEIKEPLARKLTDLLEQNKRIAKGLILLEKYVREKQGLQEPKEKEELENIF